MDPELLRDRGIIDLLRDFLSDVNPMVLSNVVASLTEICDSLGIDYFITCKQPEFISHR